jgi:hypothetical protein
MASFDLLVSANARAEATLLSAPEILSSDPFTIRLDRPAWRSSLETLIPGCNALLAIDDDPHPGVIETAVTIVARHGPVSIALLDDVAGTVVANASAALGAVGLQVERVTTIEVDGQRLPLLRFTAGPASNSARLTALGLASIRQPRDLGVGPWGCRVWGVRVGFVGGVGLGLLGGVVRSVVVDRSWLGSVGEVLDGWLDVLVVDAAPEGWDEAELSSVIDEARGLGARVVGVRSSSGVPAWSGVVDLELGLGGEGGGWLLRPSVDVRMVNPMGTRRVEGGRVALVGSVNVFRDRWDEVARVVELAGGPGRVDVVDVGVGGGGVGVPADVDLVDLGADPVGVVAALRGYVGVMDHVALHVDVWEQAEWLVRLAAAGVPVVVASGVDGELGRLLGEELASALGEVSLEMLTDVERRDRVSVDLRRVALREGSRVTRWEELLGRVGVGVQSPPMVSVVMSTNRPEFLEHAISQISRQSYPWRELVVALHGNGFTKGVEDWLEEKTEDPLHIVRVAETLTLGDALNAGTEAATGELITKWDDDDWYGTQHLWDLVQAMEYSGAQLVGKAAEFVYLAELDLTIRRIVTGAETSSTTLAGGTLMLRRDDLLHLGGWRRVRRHVDLGLIEDVLEADARVFRTHGYGYILNRHDQPHAWSADLDYFLRQSVEQHRGLMPEIAGI